MNKRRKKHLKTKKKNKEKTKKNGEPITLRVTFAVL